MVKKRHSSKIRVGQGIDIHKFAPLEKPRSLFLGGVNIPHPRGLLGHSDADVLLHAICDAILGAAGLGDIGAHFPDSDPKWRGTDSTIFLRTVYGKVKELGWYLGNIDCTVIAEEPKLLPHISLMKERIASCLELRSDEIGIKASTAEGLGSIGRKEGIVAYATALLISEEGD